jgi:glycerol-3-phosphate responsive antiterminator
MRHDQPITLTQIVEVDERGRVSLGKNNVRPGQYIAEINEADGVITLHPAQVVKSAQMRLLARSEVIKVIDTLAAKENPKASTRGRPKRPKKS